MRVKLLALVVVAAAAIGVSLAVGQDEEPWPPAWYVDRTTNHAEHLALWKRLRRRAVAQADIDFPPSKAKLDLLRLSAVGAAASETRPTDARVYFSNQDFASTVLSRESTSGASVYVLAVRGRFSTAEIGPPPGASRWNRMPPFYPMLVTMFDPATMNTTATYLGPIRDLSPLGESVQLNLDQEPA